ncbi:MAG: BCD family MFS transporter [Bosea sp. (in: a-proteobacteria)]|jgi:BCD family chlorophyll transporter-like MFS transporter
MRPELQALADEWRRFGLKLLPFADAGSADLPLKKLLRLSLFQFSVGMATVLLIGTLNRVLIVEMNVAASLVAVMVAIPLLFAPFRALVGFKSDHHRSAFGWRRVPYIWIGTLLQFGGLAIMPFALILLSGDTWGPWWVGHVASAIAFLAVGAGLQTTQTAGLALATDLAAPSARPRVVALMYTMLLVGMVISGLVFSLLLADFSQIRLIQVVQGAASMTLVLNVVALWKQEARNPDRARASDDTPAFREVWARFANAGRTKRFLLAVALGTAAFNMQDVVLEPYGGEILKLSVGETTALTGLMATGALFAFGLAARQLMRGIDPSRLAAYGAVVGLVAFSFVILSAPLEMPMLFRIGTVLIGFGGGLFSVGTLTGAMALDKTGGTGLALGAWGAVQALAMGLSIAAGGVLRDIVSHMATTRLLGPALTDAAVGYSAVYHLELLLLFITLVVIGPLVGRTTETKAKSPSTFGLAELPS